MSSVRSRLEAERRAKQDAAPDFVPRSSRSSLVVGNAPTRSTRQHAMQREDEAQPEVLTPPRTAGATTGFDGENNVAFRSVRQREQRAKTLAEIAATPPDRRTAVEQYWIDFHKEQEAQKEQWEREAAEKQARINAENDARGKFNERMLPVRLMLDEYDASESERTKIWDIAVQHPDFSVDRLYATLLEMRRLAAAPKPDWKI